MIHLLQFWVRNTLRLFVKQILIIDYNHFSKTGPLIIASNHPNSFLDAIVIAAFWQGKVHYLARGGVFKTAIGNWFFRAIGMLPVYRLREGREQLHKNAETLDTSHELLKNDGILLIFSEGLCRNEWKLRPLKKGTARITINAWKDKQIGAKLNVLPITINYNQFDKPGKIIRVFTGKLITKDDIDFSTSEGNQRKQFNDLLATRLRKNLLRKEQAAKPVVANHPIRKKMGFYLQWPLLFLINSIAKYKTKGTVHYDSSYFLLYFLLFPLYVLLLAFLLWKCLFIIL